MAEKNQPMFRDFLGLGHTDEVKQVGYTSSDAIHVSRTSPEFDSEGDGETMATRASSGTSGRFKTSSVPGGLVSPSFCLALPSSSDPGSGKLGYIFCCARTVRYVCICILLLGLCVGVPSYD